MNRESRLPVPVDAHHQRGSVTLQSPGEFPASVQEQSFMGEGQEIPEIRNMALSGSEPMKLESYCRALTESCVNDFLTEIQAAPRESSPGERPCERLCCHRRHVENWMEPWSRISLSWNWLKRQCHVHSQDITELLAGKVRRLLQLFC